MLKILNEMVLELCTTNSSNEKKEILKKYNNDERIKTILLYTYDKINKKYWITSKNLKKKNDLFEECSYSNIIELLDALDRREITGHKAISIVNSFIEQNEEYKELIYNIIDRNLKTRTDSSMINKIFPDLIPVFDVALAIDYMKKKKFVSFLNQKWYASRKLDGCVEYSTIIEFEDGRKLKIGDVVRNRIKGAIKSYNTETGQIEYKQIKDWMENLDDINNDNNEWFEIESESGEKITLTGNHKVWCANLGIWKRTDELDGADMLLFNENDVSFVEAIRKLNYHFVKYDLEVEENHNFFANRILVHNCRCIVRKNDDGISATSRQGIPFHTLRVLLDNFDLPNGVYDGEICIVDEFGDEHYKDIMKEISKKGHTIENPKYKVFDCLTEEEFDSRTGTRLLEDRYNVLNSLVFDNPYVDIVEQIVIRDDNHLDELKEKAAENGWEGLIIRENLPYEGRRTRHMLKVKAFFDAEFVALSTTNSFQRMIINGKEQEIECLKNVSIDYKGFMIDVGSGWTKKERLHYYEHPEEIIGKIMTVQWFEETHNEKGETSLRFPTKKWVFLDKRDV